MANESQNGGASLPELAKRAGVIARNVHLKAINLRQLDVTLLSELPESDIPVSIGVTHTVEHLLRKVDPTWKLSVRIHFRVTVRSNESELFRMKAVASAEYDLNRGAPESAVEGIPAFAATNGVMHVWPYFRELVQSTAWRMGIPPFPIPLFRVVEPSKPVETAATAFPSSKTT